MIVIVPTKPGASSPEITLLHRKQPLRGPGAATRFNADQIRNGMIVGEDRITWSKRAKEPAPTTEEPTISILDR